jgi:hypothetical protein
MNPGMTAMTFEEFIDSAELEEFVGENTEHYRESSRQRVS